MVNFRSVTVVFVALTVIFAAAAGYLAANPRTVVSTLVVTSTQPGSITTSTQLSTVTNIVTQTVTSIPATTSKTTTSISSNATAGAVPVYMVSGAAANPAFGGFYPATVTLVRGVNATVTWTNQDSATHTVTSLTVPAGAETFASGNLIAGATFTVTFTVPGTYTYHCQYHGWMTGTIVVK